jgi:hypothetical protein
MMTRLPEIRPLRQPQIRARRGAAGKSLLVYLFSGSLGLALLAFILFKMIGW